MKKPFVSLLAFLVASVVPLGAQAPPATQQPQPPPQKMKVEVRPGSPRQQIPMDPERARQLYIPTDPALQSPGHNYQADIDGRLATEARYADGLQGAHRLPEGELSQPHWRHGHPGLPVPAAAEARAEGARRDGLGARRRPRELGHHDVPVREGGGGARLRDHRARVPRQHRLRRGAPPGDRLRRLRGGRHDVRRRLPEDAAARGSRPRRHDGLEPRRLHHAALGLPRRAPVQGRGGDRAGHQPGLPPVAQGPGLPAGLLDPEADPGAAVREAGAVHRALAAVPRGQAEGAAARARGDQRPRRELRRGPDDRGRAAVAEAGPRRDEDLRRPRPLGPERRPLVQPPRRPEDARARGLARADRLVEPHVGRSSSGSCAPTKTGRSRRRRSARGSRTGALPVNTPLFGGVLLTAGHFVPP